MYRILFLVRKFCNVEIMPMVVVGRWRHKGGPLEPHPIFIFQTIFRSNLITMIKRELREPVAKFDIIPDRMHWTYDTNCTKTTQIHQRECIFNQNCCSLLLRGIDGQWIGLLFWGKQNYLKFSSVSLHALGFRQEYDARVHHTPTLLFGLVDTKDV